MHLNHRGLLAVIGVPCHPREYAYQHEVTHARAVSLTRDEDTVVKFKGHAMHLTEKFGTGHLAMPGNVGLNRQRNRQQDDVSEAIAPSTSFSCSCLNGKDLLIPRWSSALRVLLPESADGDWGVRV
jgi:hypothetical protein